MSNQAAQPGSRHRVQTVELSLSSAEAKRRVLPALDDAGYRVGPGPIRLAYPYCLQVEEPDCPDRLLRRVRELDPTVGIIASA